MEEITQVFNSCVFEIWWLPKGQKDDVSFFSLKSSFAILPQFIFNLRRSQFVHVFNNSPNETAYFCMLLNRKNVTNFIVYFCWMHTSVLLSFMVWLLLSGATGAIIINHSIKHLLNGCKHLMMMYTNSCECTGVRELADIEFQELIGCWGFHSNQFHYNGGFTV